MLKDITLGQFFPGNSCVHRLDPRVKLVLMVAYIVLVFLVGGFAGYGVLAAFIVLVAVLSKIKPKFLLRSIKPVLIIVIMTFVLNVLFTRGEVPLLEWGFIKIYAEGIRFAAMMALRLVFLLVGTSLLTLTTSPVVLTDGLERLLSPLRKIGFPAHELAMMMTIALRFIPTLLEEADKIMKAQMARGADFESGNIIDRAKAMIPLLVPLFVSAFRRAGDLAMAMEARCYHGGEGRTRMRVLRITKNDWIAVAAVAAMIVLTSVM